MPRAESPAADAATPETTSTAAPASVDAPQPDVPRWRYDSDDPLIYSHVPVTPKRGDVVAWPGNPVRQPDGTTTVVPGPPAADRRWTPTTDPVTRWPDNHPDTVAANNAAAQAAASVKEG